MREKNVTSIQKQIDGGGTFQKYRLVTTGEETGMIFFLFNELLLMLTSIPGQMGYALRRFGYSFLCAQLGSNVKIGCDCSFRRPHRISIGDNTELGHRVSVDVKNHGEGIVFEKNVVVGHSTIFSCPGGKISVGEGSTIGKYCRLGSLEGLTLGRNVTMGDYSYIVGAGHAYNSLDRPIILQPVVCKGKNVIGDNVVIEDRVTILDGVSIGSGAKILTGSLVNKDVPAHCTVSGIPAGKIQ